MSSTSPVDSSNVPKESPRFKSIHSVAGPAFILSCGALMVWFGWRRWSDLMIDIGNQLYIPWQISEGQVLYHDLYYVFGPLSPLLHGLIFKILGPGALYLSLFNLFLTLGLTGIIYKLFLRFGGPWTATLVGLNFLTVHALGQHKILGNFNFVQPYSYDLTHGILLSFVALYLFMRYIESPNLFKLWGIGFLLGLIYLTKIEVMLAAILSIFPGVVYYQWRRNPSIKALTLAFIFLLSAMGLPFLMCWIYFSFHMPMTEGLNHLVSPYALALNQNIHDAPYIKIHKGTYHLQENLTYISIYTGCLFLIIYLLVQIETRLNRMNKNNFLNGFLICSVFVGLLLHFFRDIPWKLLLLPLPILLIIFIFYLIKNFRGGALSDPCFQKNLFLLVLTVFSLTLTFKIFFRVVILHYGFALAMPATLVAIYLIMNVVPRVFKEKFKEHGFYKLTASVLILFYIGALNFDSYLYFSKKVVPIGQGPDMLYDYHPQSRTLDGQPYMKGLMVRFTLDYLRENVPSDAELTVILDAVMLNYLSRHRDPAKGFLLNPLTWVTHGQDGSYLRDLQSHPPDYIIFMDRNFPAWHISLFGRDFGQDIYRWVHQDYDLIHQIGATPFTEAGFGIQIFKQKSKDDHPHTR